MDIFRTADEVWKGLTNVPICLFAILFFILLKKEKAPLGKRMFFLLSWSSFLGACVHTFAFPAPVRRAVWVVLMAFLYLTVRAAFILFLAYGGGYESFLVKTKLPVLVSMGVCYAASAVLTLLDNDLDILIFGFWAAFWMVPIICKAFSEKKRYPRMRLIIVILCGALACQLVSTLLPPGIGVVGCHLLIIASLFFIYKLTENT